MMKITLLMFFVLGCIKGASLIDEKTDVVGKLYHLKAENIKNIDLNKTNSGTTVNITTK